MRARSRCSAALIGLTLVTAPLKAQRTGGDVQSPRLRQRRHGEGARQAFVADGRKQNPTSVATLWKVPCG